MPKITPQTNQSKHKGHIAHKSRPSTALLIGATGRIGKLLTPCLAATYDTLIIIARQPPEVFAKNMQFFALADFDNLGQTVEHLDIDASADAFCCLWHDMDDTDIQHKVCYDYPLDFAKACHAKGVQRFFLLSTHKAHLKSRKTDKAFSAKLEKAISSLGFATFISFRPDIITPERLHKGNLSFATLEQNARHLFDTAILQKHALDPKDIAASMAQAADNCHKNPHYPYDKPNSKLRFWHKKPTMHIISHKQMLADALARLV